MPSRKIIHVDLDAFFCAVEELKNPNLKGKPFAVGGKPQERGVVASCSYVARHFGIHSAMPMARAIRLCRDLILVPPDRVSYHNASESVMAILKNVTPLVEQLSIDEAFLEIDPNEENIEIVARNIQTRIREGTGLPCSIGGATNKLVAKIATDFGKGAHKGGGYPNAITIIPPGKEREFLAPLAVEMLWGVGPKTAEHLREMSIFTIGQIAERNEREMGLEFGQPGVDLVQRARGVDNRPVVIEYETKSISQETTFQKDIRDEKYLTGTIDQLAEMVAFRLRRDGFMAGTVKIKIRWPDFSTITRQVTLPGPIDQDREIASISKRLFYEVWDHKKAVRLLGVGATHLVRGAHQLSLWEAPLEKERKVTEVIDLLRERFGERVITKGRLPEKQNSADKH